MRKYKWEHICVVDTIYSLFLYLLISSEKDLNHTFFFWGEGIPAEIRNKFIKQSYTFKKINSSIYRKIYLLILYQFGAIMKWPFLRNKKLVYWGHSHLFFSSSIVRDNKMNVIEDGLLNYKKQYVPSSYKRFKKIKRILWGALYIKEEFIGENKLFNKIYLTKTDYPKILEDNTISIINLKQIWNESPQNKKELINEIFDLNYEDINKINKADELLLTQCFSEDSYMTEEDKIQMYKTLINDYCNIDKLLIKPHPRETTLYAELFPNISIFTKKIPIELLELNGLDIKTVYTINSSAAYNFSKVMRIVVLGNDFMNKFKINYE